MTRVRCAIAGTGSCARAHRVIVGSRDAVRIAGLDLDLGGATAAEPARGSAS